MIIKSPAGAQYRVNEKRLGSTEKFTLYECVLPDGSVGILKIATAIGYNGLLDREAYLLEIMTQGAQELEEEYKVATEGKKLPLNNHFFFPQLIETFIAVDQDKRRVMILGFSHISEKLAELVPLSYLRLRDRVCVDPRTSAWILGKLLKLLVFVHGQGISVGEITEENILINKKKHFVSLFDWTNAAIDNTKITAAVASEEIAQATRHVIALLGGIEGGHLPSHEQLVDSRYEDLLMHFASKGITDAFSAHEKFYDLIRSLWPREYHPFTTHNLI